MTDISGDKFSIKEGFDLVLCCSLLEHINNSKLAIRNTSSVVNKGGYLIVTIPFRYRFHLDPIDNLARLTPIKLGALFSEFEMISSEIVNCHPNKKKGKINLKNLLTNFKNDITSTYNAIKSKRWDAVRYNIRRCLFRTPQISCVLLRKT